jgi:transcriptional regulator with XRE-family HTH domain
MSRRAVVGRYDPKPDLRQLLRERGLTVAAAERKADRAPGSISRLLSGRRGKNPPYDTVRRLSVVLGKPIQIVANAIELSITEARERRQLKAQAERARKLME